LVDMRMMRIPTVWWTNISGLLIGVGMYASIVVIPPFVQTATSHGYGFGASPAGSGFFLVPQAAAMLVIGLVNGRITAAIGAKVALFIGCVLGAVSFAVLIVGHHAPWEFYVSTGVSGIGFGLAFAAMSNLVVMAVPDSQTGIATGMNANIRTIGGAIGSQVVASILASGIASGAVPKEAGYVASFGVLGVAFALAAVAALVIPGRVGVRVAADDRVEPALVAALPDDPPGAR
jgi:MFS family permease